MHVARGLAEQQRVPVHAAVNSDSGSYLAEAALVLVA